MDYQQILERIYQSILSYAKEGKQADYIPELDKVDPDQFGMCIHTIYGEEVSVEKADTHFSTQSISIMGIKALELLTTETKESIF